MKTQLAMLTIATLLVASCGNNSTSKEENKPAIKEAAGSASGKLNGSWVVRRAEGDMADMNVGTNYSFEEGKLSFSQGGFNNPGKTNITDTTFSFQADGNELHFMYNYHFIDDTLVVAMQNSTQTFYLTRQ